MKALRAASAKARADRLAEAQDVLRQLGFGGRQANEVAAYTFLACLGLGAAEPWSAARSPLIGITPCIQFIKAAYGVEYAPNTRETIRDEAVKYFVAEALLLRNPDKPDRPTNSGRTVYQIEPTALRLLQIYGTLEWAALLATYQTERLRIRAASARQRALARIAVKLPSGGEITLSPGGQNPLIKSVIEDFCGRFVPGGTVLYVGDTEGKFLHYERDALGALGINLAAPEKMPDVVVHDTKRNWLVLIEAVTSAGPVDSKRRQELRTLFANAKAGLVYVSAFATREVMRAFLADISWETEVWVASAPDHLIHFNGERFLGPYADAIPLRQAPDET